VNANGKFNGQVRFMEADLEKPLRTRKPTVWSVWNDLFHKTVTDEQIGDAFAVMLRAPRHRFLILTKRPERMAEWFRGFYTGQQPSKNVALGTTVGHPDSLWRIGELLKCPAAMRSLSVEPLLEELDLTTYLTPADRDHIGEDYGTWVAGKWQPPLDQLIIGPETGPGARPCKLEWIESLVDQADAAGLAVFVKAFPIDGRVSKDMAEWPEWARRREFPEWGGDDG
jgi:protein gp37